MRTNAKSQQRRRGVAAVIAMVYLLLFSTLAIGFYAATTTSMQVAQNEERAGRALMAAESGLDFMQYLLRDLMIPVATAQQNLLAEVYDDLSARVDGTGNLRGGRIRIAAGMIHIPAGANDYIDLGTGRGRFRATIEPLGEQVRLKIYGVDSSAPGDVRGIKLDFAQAENASRIFDFGVASVGTVSMNSNARIRGLNDPTLGSVLVMTGKQPAVTMASNASISGDLSFLNPNAVLSYAGNSTVGGERLGTAAADAHLHFGVGGDVIFPTIKSDVFKPYATNVLSVPGKKYDTGTLRNVLIKANTNPVFDGGVQVEGVIYVEQPNQVSFNSNAKVRGVIAVDTPVDALGQPITVGTYASNVISFDSNVTIQGLETLDPAAYGDLTKLGGAVILAPNFAVRFNSNFGSTGGSIIADKLHFDSNAKGAVEGSVICLKDSSVQFDAQSEILIESRGTAEYPPGVYFGTHYVPLPDTYEEMRK